MINGRPSPYPAASPPERLSPPEPENPAAIGWPGQEEGWPGETFDPDEYAAKKGLDSLPEVAPPINSDRQPLNTLPIESAPRHLELPAATKGIGSVATKTAAAPEATSEPAVESDRPTPERQLLNSMQSRLKLLARDLEAQAENASKLSKQDIDNYQRKAETVLKLAESLPEAVLAAAEHNKATLPDRLKTTLGLTKLDIAVDRSRDRTVKKSRLLDRKEAVQLSSQVAVDKGQADQFSSWRFTHTGMDLFDRLIAARNKGAAEQANIQLSKDRNDTENRVRKILESDEAVNTLTAKVREEYVSQFAISLHRQLDRYEQDVESGGISRADLPADNMVVTALTEADIQSMQEVLTTEKLIAPDVKKYTQEARGKATKAFLDNIAEITSRLDALEREDKAAEDRKAVVTAFESNVANAGILAFAKGLEREYLDIKDIDERYRKIRKALARKYHPDKKGGNADAMNWAAAKYASQPKKAQ